MLRYVERFKKLSVYQLTTVLIGQHSVQRRTRLSLSLHRLHDQHSVTLRMDTVYALEKSQQMLTLNPASSPPKGLLLAEQPP